MYKNKRLPQEFWNNHNKKFIVLKPLKKRNDFLEFLWESNIPINKYAYERRNDETYTWNVLYISKISGYLAVGRTNGVLSKKKERNELSEFEFLKLFKLLYYDIYGNYTSITTYKKKEK